MFRALTENGWKLRHLSYRLNLNSHEFDDNVHCSSLLFKVPILNWSIHCFTFGDFCLICLNCWSKRQILSSITFNMTYKFHILRLKTMEQFLSANKLYTILSLSLYKMRRYFERDRIFLKLKSAKLKSFLYLAWALYLLFEFDCRMA